MPSYFYNAVNLLGGVSLFLYGASQSTEAFRSAFGAEAREALSRFTQKKSHALLFGMILSAVAQGSTVSTSIAISFADVGMLSLAGAVVVTMGSSIGGAFVTFLASLDIVKFSPLLLAVSFAMTRFGRDWVKKTGSVLHALSLILLGMLLLKLGVDPLLANPAVRDGVAEIARKPFAVFFAALIGTAVLQSSASVMALAVTVAMTGALPQSAIFPAALGAHLGSTVTMLLAAMGGRRNARLLGVAAFLYKLAGTAAFASFTPWAEVFWKWAALPAPGALVLAQILLVSFNAAIFYPWPQLLIYGSELALSHMQGADLGAPFYLDDELLGIPSLSVRLLSKEMVRLISYVEALLQMRLFPHKKGGEPELELELEKSLPEGIRELTEACERYMYAIQPPSIGEDPVTEREYRSVSYAMFSLREIARQAQERVRGIEPGALKDARERQDWEKMASFFMEAARDAFHAFALGDAELAQRAAAGEAEFEKFAQSLHSRLLAGEARRRENFALMDFVTAARRFLRSARGLVPGANRPEANNPEGGSPGRGDF